MRKLCFVLFMFFTVAGTLIAHPIKLTNSRLYYNHETERYELLINFFLDDLSAHLTTIYHKPVTAENITDNEQMLLVEEYIVQRFVMYSGNKQLPITIQSLTILEENILQVIAICPEMIRKIDLKIENTLLFDAFDNQSNILHMELFRNAKKQMARFSHDVPMVVFQLVE